MVDDKGGYEFTGSTTHNGQTTLYQVELDLPNIGKVMMWMPAPMLKEYNVPIPNTQQLMLLKAKANHGN